MTYMGKDGANTKPEICKSQNHEKIQIPRILKFDKY